MSPQPKAPALDSKLPTAQPLSAELPPFICPKPPTDFNKPTAGNATKFLEREAVISESEAWKVDIRHEIGESLKSVP